MKITDVKITVVDLGKQQAYRNSIIRRTGGRRGRVEIYTDEGVVGMAPGNPMAARCAFILGPIRNKLLGEDPLRIGYLWAKMYMGGTRKPVAKGDYIAAMGPVDNALWDLKGKALNQPVWKLAGGVQTRIDAYASGGYYVEGMGLAELGAEYEAHVARGFRGVKIKVGWSGVTLREDAARVRTAREAIGPDIKLMIDANCAWDAKTALKFGRLVEAYDPFWFEEPVHADDFRGAALLVSSLDMPIASGENEFTRWGARDLIEAQAADIIQCDPTLCGGISEWLKIAAMASACHLKMAPHGGPNIGSVCVAAVENGLIAENYPAAHHRGLMGPVDFREDGYIYMTDKPGLGIDWNEKEIEERRIDG
jgi:D-arabinonate dehydratase